MSTIGDAHAPAPPPRRLRRRGIARVGSRPPRERGDRRRSFLLTLIAVLVLAAFLSPMLKSMVYAIKSTDQITQAGSPLYPADPAVVSIGGEDREIFIVPIDGAE